MMGYSLLQWAQCDPFFRNLSLSEAKAGHRNLMVGMLGNADHLGAYLALTLPFLLLQPGKGWRWLVGLNLCLLGKLVLVEHAIGGAVAALGGGDVVGVENVPTLALAVDWKPGDSRITDSLAYSWAG